MMTKIEVVEQRIAETRQAIDEYCKRAADGTIPAESWWSERERYIGLLETDMMYVELLQKYKDEAKA
jgi:hypothetical protein